MNGAHVYQHHCSVCHGNLVAPESAIAKGMFPHPPQLFQPEKGVTDDPVGETYWKVKNGIRLTGMPGFDGNLTEQEIWEVSLFLAHADHLPESAKQVLQQQ
jgi:mono/diheme cytochrome c family protein